MDTNIIRAIILVVMGVVLILFPGRIYKYQVYIIKKLHIRYNAETDKNYNTYYGIIMIIISIILLGVGLS